MQLKLNPRNAIPVLEMVPNLLVSEIFKRLTTSALTHHGIKVNKNSDKSSKVMIKGHKYILNVLPFSLLLSQNWQLLSIWYRIELIQFGIGTVVPVLQVVLIFWSSSNLCRFCHRITLCWHKCACWVVLDLRAISRRWIYRWVLFRFDCGFSALVKARFIICWYGH